jgi:uncharacterized protein
VSDQPKTGSSESEGSGESSAAPESILKFPLLFPIKVMGKREDGFAQWVCDLVLRHAPDFNPATIEMRPSSNGKYISVTVTVNAQSQAQLDNIYRELSAAKDKVLYLL